MLEKKTTTKKQMRIVTDTHYSGVWTSFSGHSPDLQVVKNFHSPTKKTT
jgi:hypothetical protein